MIYVVVQKQPKLIYWHLYKQRIIIMRTVLTLSLFVGLLTGCQQKSTDTSEVSQVSVDPATTPAVTVPAAAGNVAAGNLVVTDSSTTVVPPAVDNGSTSSDAAASSDAGSLSQSR